MQIPAADIAYAKTYLANFSAWYRGPNILNTGFTLEDPEERQATIDAAWTEWSSFTRSYFMAMLSTLAGQSTFLLDRDILRQCTPKEALGARAAADTFWKRDLAMRGVAKRLGGWSMTPVQHAILADEMTNKDVFQTVERTMQAAITTALRTRRNFLGQLDEDTDHAAGFHDDMAHFFGTGRPTRLSPKDRNASYDGLLL